jgi:hypothetical protein
LHKGSEQSTRKRSAKHIQKRLKSDTPSQPSGRARKPDFVKAAVKSARADTKRKRWTWIFDEDFGVAYTIGLVQLFGTAELILRCRSHPRARALLQIWVNDIASGLQLTPGTIGEHGYSLRQPSKDLLAKVPGLHVMYGTEYELQCIELFKSNWGFWNGERGRKRSEAGIRRAMRRQAEGEIDI